MRLVRVWGRAAVCGYGAGATMADTAPSAVRWGGAVNATLIGR